MNTFRYYCYELYKNDWKLQHGITREKEMFYMMDYLAGIVNAEFEEYSYDDYLIDFGYNGECYVYFEEFLENEFKDEEYMSTLLSSEDKYVKEALLEHYKNELEKIK